MSSRSSSTIIVNVNNFQPAYTSLGLGAIPPGTTVPDAVEKLLKGLKSNLQATWPSSFPAFDNTQIDSAIMAPWSANIPGTAPTCVIDAITLDFQNWELPVDKNTIVSMAKEITQQISNQGGNTGTFDGKRKIAGAEHLFWSVSYTTAIVVNDPEETGILYAFSAVLG